MDHNKQIYLTPLDNEVACTCKGNARRNGKNISAAIATSAGYGISAILRAFEELQKTYCKQCQWKFKAGFFEEKQRVEEGLDNLQMEVANVG